MPIWNIDLLLPVFLSLTISFRYLANWFWFRQLQHPPIKFVMLDFLLSMACLLFLNDCSKEKGGVSLFLPRVPQGSILGALFILIFFIIHLSSLLTPTVFPILLMNHLYHPWFVFRIYLNAALLDTFQLSLWKLPQILLYNLVSLSHLWLLCPWDCKTRIQPILFFKKRILPLSTILLEFAFSISLTCLLGYHFPNAPRTTRSADIFAINFAEFDS